MGYLISLIKNDKYKLQERIHDLTDLQILVLGIINRIWVEMIKESQKEDD
ncbi:hypothetical protein [Methanobacterium sp.]